MQNSPVQDIGASMAVIDAFIQNESRDRYLTYALSVVSGRALPDVRDGLKPVQRRILFAMLNNLGLTPDKSHRKSAAVVGEVLAKFHPHGDVACYEAMVRMAQDFSLRYPLVDGQGNFGSLDGDNAAAYRYTEAKLRAIALEVIGEIDEETVSFRDNFDGTVQEPTVFPSRVPNLLINGVTGIAVGMATSIPPHNLRDTVKALLELAEDAEISEAKLAGTIKGPDFPTGCMILNSRKELSEIYKTGRGSIRMRGEWVLEEGTRGKQLIVINSVPYAINKSDLVEKIANLIIDRKVPQLQDVRDESTDQVRVVLELSAGAEPEVAMAYLFKNTPLESNFPVNMTSLVPVIAADGSEALRPEVLSLKGTLQHFLTFRTQVTERKLTFERKKLLERIHILEGLMIIYDALDIALKIVRSSNGRADAAEKLRERFKLSEIQAFAVVDMRIYQLSRTNIEEIREELEAKQKRVSEIDAILKSPQKILAQVKRELEAVVEKFGDKRKSQLAKEHVEIEFNEEDYVVNEDVYAIVTKDGWIKRIRQNNEVSATRIREGDSILRAHPASTLDYVIFYTNLGSVYSLKVIEFPASGGYGDPIQKVLKFRDGEEIVESFVLRAGDGKGAQRATTPEQQSLFGNYPFTITEGQSLIFVSKDGTGFSAPAVELIGIKRNGKRIMKLRDGDTLATVSFMAKRLALITHQGYGLVIDSKEVPLSDNPVVGVSLIGVREGDKLVAALSYEKDATVVLTLDGGKEREIPSKEIITGHRALKGNKVVARDEIVAARIK